MTESEGQVQPIELDNGAQVLGPGEYRVSGDHSGAVTCETGARLVVLGTLTGATRVKAGAELGVAGAVIGALTIEAGGEVFVEPSGVTRGAIENHGKMFRLGSSKGASSGTGESIG